MYGYVSSQAGYFFNSFKCHEFATQLRHRVAEVTSPMQPSNTFRMRAETTKKPCAVKTRPAGVVEQTVRWWLEFYMIIIRDLFRRFYQGG